MRLYIQCPCGRRAVWNVTRLISCSLLLTVWITVHAVEPKPASPEEALDNFYKMINKGALLTPSGWKRASTMFERESVRPDKEIIFVVTEFPLGNGPMGVKGDRAVAYQKWVDDVGSIDSKFQYHPPPKENREVEGVIRVFSLVRTATHWELTNDNRLKEINGPMEWRIEGSLTARTSSRAAAIQYLTRKLNEIGDPTLKANAERTISILKGLPQRRSHI